MQTLIAASITGVTFSKDPSNLRATHSYKYHPNVQKSVGVLVQQRATAKGVKPQIVVRHSTGVSSKPKSSRTVARLAGAKKGAESVDVAAAVRPDLRASALQHYSALHKAQRVKPSKAA